MKLLVSILLAATGVIARAAESPSLIAYARQADGASMAQLVVGVNGASGPVDITIALPPGWNGATGWRATGSELRTFPLVAAADAVPGLGTIIVTAGGLSRRAWVRAPGERAPAALRPSTRWLPLVRR